jgi:hypothetical protein
MKPTFKVIIFYEGKEHTVYIGDADTKSRAEKKAITKFKTKHKLGNVHITAHADNIGNEPPVVMMPKFFRVGAKPSGKPNWRMKIVRERIVPMEFKYRVTATYTNKSKRNVTTHVDVMGHDGSDALLKGKRELAPYLQGYKVLGWVTRRIS